MDTSSSSSSSLAITMMTEQEEQQIQELREQFRFFDCNGSGWIEEDDLKQAFELMGAPKDNYQIRKLFQSLDTNGDGRLSFDEYVDWNRQLFIDDMRRKFQEIDLDGNGTLDKTELRKFAMDFLNYGVTEEELDQLMYEMDITQKDHIGIEEFITAMASTRTGHAYYIVNGEMYVKKIIADFEAIDQDGSGYLDRDELMEMARKLAFTLTEDELDALMDEMDEDNDGQISLQEFIAATVKISV